MDHDDGQKLVDKLNQLIPVEKARELERVRSYEMAEKAEKRRGQTLSAFLGNVPRARR